MVGAVLALPPPAVRAERLPLASFRTASGLAYDRVLRIVRDSRGFLWFCTSQGLSRFDGQRFRTYTAADGLPESVVNDLLEARDGTYWVATDGGGVARFDPRVAALPERRFTVFPLGDEHVTAEVYLLRQDRRGRIWAATRGGLFRLEAGGARFERVRLDVPGQQDRTVPVWALAEDADGSMWVGTEYGLSRVADAGTAHYALAPFPGGDTVWSVLFDGDGRLWVAQENTLFVVKPRPFAPAAAGGHPWTRLLSDTETLLADGRVRLPQAPGEAGRYTRAHGLIGEGPGPLLRTADGHMWIGNRGVSEFDGERFRSFAEPEGLVPSAVISLGDDVEGNVWMGTRTLGAMRLLRHGFVGESAPGVTGGDLVTSFVEEEPGRVWAVLGPGRLRRYERRRADTVALPLPSAAFRVGRPGPYPGILRDSDSEWWAGTAEGLYRFPPVRAEALARTRPRAVYTARDGLASDGIGAMFEDRAGDLWISHTTTERQVLTHWSRATGAFRAYGEADGLPPFNRVSAVAQDQAGRIFVGFSEGGVARQTATGFERLPGFDPVAMGSTTALMVDRAGRVWVATSRGGLHYLEHADGPLDDVRAQAVPEKLASNAVRAVLEDRWGRIYAAGLGGIDCLDPTTLRTVRRFTEAHGLRNFFFEGATRDARGRLWFGSSEGLVRLDPQEDLSPRRPSPARIGSLRTAGVAQAIADVGQDAVGPIELATQQNSADVEFFSLDFAGEPRLFQYRLLGAETEWSAPGTESTVHYARLGPGHYRFQVRTLGVGGLTSDHPAEVTFTIVPPLWSRAWFRAAALLAAFGLGYGAYRLRVARLVALERVRTRIAADLHDDIGSSLSQIAILSELARRRAPADEADAGPLDRIAQSSRELVDDMSDIVWAINPRRDRLGDLVHRMRRFASDTLTARDIAFRFAAAEAEAGRALDPDLRRQVLLVFKEAVNNLARHSGCRRAELDVRVENGILTVNVEDDGQGFDAAASVDGHGLASMRERARSLGGVLEVSSAPGQGTTLTLTVPVGRRRTSLPA